MDFAALIADIDRTAQAHLGGVPVVYQPEVGEAVTVTGMFDDPQVLLDQGRADVEQVGPSVWLRLADLPVHPDQDEPTLTIGGVQYTVHERQPDTTIGGSIRLSLHRKVVA